MVENVPPRQTWEVLLADPSAQLCDVRTDAEWAYVGLPDLSSAGKRVVLVQWQVYPTMARNERFVDELRAAGLNAANRIYFICRSGVRSYAAAEAAQAAA
jgi:rhodanese-related sulfurtransferase